MLSYDGIVRSSTSTLRDQLVAILAKRISGGEFPPGSRLPSLRNLEKQYGISRETAKQALARLQEQGLADILPNRGAYVPGRPRIIREEQGNIGLVLDLGAELQPAEDVELVYEPLIRNLDRQIRESGRHIITSYLNFSDTAWRNRFRDLLGKSDGLFIVGLINPDILQYLKDAGVPVVSILSNIDNDIFDDIGIDNEKTYRRAASALLESGCRNLVYIDGPDQYFQSDRRYAGCAAAAVDFMNRTEPKVRIHRLSSPAWTASAAAQAFAERPNELRGADGVIAVNDVVAAGVLRACRQEHLGIPQDISVIGSKNTMLGPGTDPPLSSIDCHFDEIAKLALERMQGRIGGTSYRPARIEITGTLIRRATTT
jgi:DNA-binding LacI/PurR family transcriptional regulator